MRWIKLGAWLLAWSVWALLAWRLYRELPRSLGPLVCKLDLKEREIVAGFVDDRHEVVAYRWNDVDSRNEFILYSALTGEKLRDIDRETNVPIYSSSRERALQRRNQELSSDSWNWVLHLPEGWRTASIYDFDWSVAVAREWEIETKKLGFENADQTLLGDSDGLIYEYPKVNYPLLALCQTILALPLVLLWSGLRWRRKRRRRLARVSPRPSFRQKET